MHRFANQEDKTEGSWLETVCDQELVFGPKGLDRNWFRSEDLKSCEGFWLEWFFF